MTRPAERRGHALIGTTIFLVLAMLLWAAVYQQTASHLRVEKACRVHAEGRVGIQRATAWGLSLLETGQPPLEWGFFYRCRMIVDGEVYLTTYIKADDDPLEYLVRVERKDPSYHDYPLAPSSFGG